jgi:hypothetical protein
MAGPLAVYFTAAATMEIYDFRTSCSQPLQAVRLDADAERIRWQHGVDAKGMCISDFDSDGLLDLASIERTPSANPSDAYSKVLTLRVAGSRDGCIRFERNWPVEFDAPPALSRCIAASRDLDSDGTADIIVCDPSWFAYPGGVRAVSGADGRVIWQATAPLVIRPGVRFTASIGVSVDLAADMNADGIEEVLVGCGQYSYDAMESGTGMVLILDGRTGAELRRVAEWAIRVDQI